ncbi:N-terminal domain of molybdenum-binding protein [Pelotomaculum thermopropionicum SI]|uniref:N-terminal domain of molybdenum-binding protein n=1 Tax=Pelotomaculum thermopropionicum (strain DSM 13744 / JCM 10971 / SI) TaxID=370438 RepID=A5CYZ2_PELTS|nr:N-terminal domain of molybdenum-binding protein [Pelotomaculum thermopropionicum SI]
MPGNKAGCGRSGSLLSPGYKIWLEKEGAILGEGLFELLSKISSAGSISQAAREMGMSYRAAWGKIRLAEKRLGLPLVITQVGGELGGGARLTPQADELMEKFSRLRREARAFIDNLFNEIFRGWPGP